MPHHHQSEVLVIFISIAYSMLMFNQIVSTMSLLAKAQGMQDTMRLYEVHIKDILSMVKVRCLYQYY